jgi:DNA repair exonuclease SbcCD nuclease subunit
MFKIIAVGDPHFQTENIPEVNLFIDKLEKLVIDEKPDLIVILGDVLHTHERLHTTPLNKAYEFFNRMRKITKTFVLVGNHDAVNNQIFLNDNHWMNALKEWDNIVIVDKVIHYETNGLHFVLCPYVPPNKFIDALNTDETDWTEADCIFAHQEFYGCKMGAIVSVEGDKWDENYPYVVSGHIHSKQTIGKNIYYCGSSMQHAFGESDNNIIPVLTWNKQGEKYNLREVDLGLPRKKIVYTDVTNIENYQLPQTEDKIKITISGVYDEFKAFKKTNKYKELIKSGTKVVFKPKKIKKEEEKNHEIQEEEEDQKDFVKILTNLVCREKNSVLYKVFEQVVNNKIIDEDDIYFF